MQSVPPSQPAGGLQRQPPRKTFTIDKVDAQYRDPSTFLRVAIPAIQRALGVPFKKAAPVEHTASIVLEVFGETEIAAVQQKVGLLGDDCFVGGARLRPSGVPVSETAVARLDNTSKTVVFKGLQRKTSMDDLKAALEKKGLKTTGAEWMTPVSQQFGFLKVTLDCAEKAKELATAGEIDLDGLDVTVEAYKQLRQARQCLNCFEFGHLAAACKNQVRCKNCGVKGHSHRDCKTPSVRTCFNCGEKHSVAWAGCAVAKQANAALNTPRSIPTPPTATYVAAPPPATNPWQNTASGPPVQAPVQVPTATPSAPEFDALTEMVAKEALRSFYKTDSFSTLSSVEIGDELNKLLAEAASLGLDDSVINRIRKIIISAKVCLERIDLLAEKKVSSRAGRKSPQSLPKI